MAATFYLGTSGFAYEQWRHGIFYPEGLSAKAMLGHYAGVFNSVEINYTFRRFPAEATLSGWREQTPDGFVFALKANQRITHHSRLRDAGETVAAFVERATTLGDRLGPILFQCPPGLRYDAGLIAEFVECVPATVRAVMEFRHPSWQAARPLLAANGIGWCVADTDEGDAADEGDWQPFGFLRLRRAEYSDDDLAAWAGRIDATLAAGRDVYCYFKHEDSGAGPRMARRLAKLTGERSSRGAARPASTG